MTRTVHWLLFFLVSLRCVFSFGPFGAALAGRYGPVGELPVLGAKAASRCFFAKDEKRVDIKQEAQYDNVMERSSAKWNAVFERLKEYKDIHGHCLVPSRFNDGRSPRLGLWVARQRQHASIDKKMSAERRRKLDAIGFVWEVMKQRRRKKLDKQWDEMYQRLVDYKTKHKDCLVPYQFTTLDNKNLGSWVQTQRLRYARGKLYEDRKEKLESLGFVFSIDGCVVSGKDERWNQMFDRLVAYKEQHGDCLVPSRYAEDRQLGEWVRSYRRLGTKDLPADRKEKLLAIGFVWDGHETAWQSMFESLTKFKQQNGHCVVTRAVEDDFPGLDQWVKWQRRCKDKLSGDRRQQLEDLGFVWDVRDHSWEEMFRQLKMFQAIHGHDRVTLAGHEQLYRWSYRQRKARNTMPAERKERLDSVGFTWVR